MLTLTAALVLQAALPADLPPLTVGEHSFHRRRLANGLRAVAVRDEGETVSVFLVVAAGERQETPETSGLAHLVEHALFTGTATTPADVHEATVEGWGGESNAFTRQDTTLYYDHALPPEHLEAVLALEADRLRHLTFDEAAFLHERERLSAEEARTFQASEGRDEELEAALYTVHPYRSGVRDAAGHTRAPLLDLATARAFYDRHYHPNRTCVVVVGPLEPTRALDAVERAFGGLAGGPPAPVPPVEPWIEAAREVRLPSNLRHERTELVWLVPARDGQERAALELCVAWLDRQELPGAVPVEASIGARVDRDLVRVAAAGEGAREALSALVARAREAGPSPDELAEVQSALADDVASTPLRARPYFSLAGLFATWEVFDQGELLAARDAAIRALGTDDVRSAARRFLDPERAVTVVFERGAAEGAPLPSDPSQLAAAAADAADAGDFERAIEAYGRLLAGHPNRMNQVIYLASRGQVYLELRDYEAAIADFETALGVVDYPAVRELLEDAYARQSAALRGEFGEERDAPRPEEPAAPAPGADAELGELEASLRSGLSAATAELERWRGLRFAREVEPEFVEQASDEKLGGWYEPDGGRLVVVLAKGAAFSRGAQLHELFHALQDQTWDLSVLQGRARTTDERHALDGLIEGEAMLAVSEILDYDFEQHAVLPPEGEITRERFDKIFHYGTGMRFVRGLRDAEPGGWPAVNRAWGAPPRSTGELFHPERYGSAPPADAGGADPLGAGEVELERDVLGELELRWLLVDEPSTRALAEELGAALVRDQWRLVRRGDGAREERWRLDFERAEAARRCVEEAAAAWTRAGWSATRSGATVRCARAARE